MKHITFKNCDELEKYLSENKYSETKFFVTPDYVKSIFGITNNGLLLYSYTNMVEDLYLEYSEEESIEDPYEAAIEWIDFNVTNIGTGSPIVVYEPPMDGFDSLFDVNGLDDILLEYENVMIGMDGRDNILIDDDLCDDDKEKLESLISNYDDIEIMYV